MAKKTQTEIAALVAKLEKHPYMVSFGSTVLEPLDGAPSIEADTETNDQTLYETEGDVCARYLVKNDLKIQLKVRDVDGALTLVKGIKQGDNLLDSTKEDELTLVPITDDTTAQTITLPHCFLQAEHTSNFGEDGSVSSITLNFVAKADATSGSPYETSGGGGGDDEN